MPSDIKKKNNPVHNIMQKNLKYCFLRVIEDNFYRVLQIYEN